LPDLIGPLQFFPLGRVPFKKKSLGIFSAPADLERAEILKPITIRGVRLRFTPKLQLIEVFGSDLTITKSVQEMITQSRRKLAPLDLWHLFSEGHPCKLFF
jgi:hypothetical protein